MKTAEKIKMLRKQKGLTQKELATALGIRDAAISKYEKGIVVNIKKDTLDKMAAIFEVSPAELLDDVAENYFSNVEQYINSLDIRQELRKALSLDAKISTYKFSDHDIDMIIDYARLVAGKK